MASSTCPSGWTVSGSKCFQVFPGPTSWLAALQLCIAQGGTLAKVESQAEHDLVQGLVGTSDPAWIGLQVSCQAGLQTADCRLQTATLFFPGLSR